MEIVEIVYKFFSDNRLDARKCLCVFIRGTDGLRQNISQVCTFARRLYLQIGAESILLHCSDASVVVIAT